MVVATLGVFLVSALLWSAFAHRGGPRGGQGQVIPPPLPPPPPPPPPAAPTSAPAESARTGSNGAGRVARDSAPQAATPPATAQPPSDETGQLSYMVLYARSEIRRQIRASAGLTYLNDIVAESDDSMLHRWDNRTTRPVRVYVPVGVAANFQSSFIDAVQGAFDRWQEAGVPVRFSLIADSSEAEVRFQWRVQFEIERTGQTDLKWDGDGHLTQGLVTLATFDPKGRPLDADAVRVVALHEIGHLIGLDHSPDSTDIMFARTRVRDLSARDIATAELLYRLSPGSLR
jgi:matrixin